VLGWVLVLAMALGTKGWEGGEKDGVGDQRGASVEALSAVARAVAEHGFASILRPTYLLASGKVGYAWMLRGILPGPGPTSIRQHEFSQAKFTGMFTTIRDPRILSLHGGGATFTKAGAGASPHATFNDGPRSSSASEKAG